MKLSNRIVTLNGEPGQSDGWQVYYRAREMKLAGEAVTMLSIGEHDRSGRIYHGCVKAFADAAREGGLAF